MKIWSIDLLLFSLSLSLSHQKSYKIILSFFNKILSNLICNLDQVLLSFLMLCSTDITKEKMENALQLKSLNHVSQVCRSVNKSLDFYQNVLGFSPIKRPGSFDFNGAWLFNYGIGIHLLQSEDPNNMPAIRHINPKDNHIPFQCENIGVVEKKLKEMEIEYVKRRVEEAGVHLDQLFFHDPDGSMIEICNCEILPICHC